MVTLHRPPEGILRSVRSLAADYGDTIGGDPAQTAEGILRSVQSLAVEHGDLVGGDPSQTARGHTEVSTV